METLFEIMFRILYHETRDKWKTAKNKYGGNYMNESQTFIFEKLPENLDELKALPEASLDSPYKTAALAVAIFCAYGKNPDATIEMLDWLMGPEEVSTYKKQFFKERLSGKLYKPFSFFAGASPENGYTPTAPYTITVTSNDYSFVDENWATMYVKSSGADSERPIKLRKKPSTGQYFVNDIQCFSDIKIPVAEDPWA